MAGARKKPNRAGKYQGFFLNMNGQRVFFTGTHDRRETLRMGEKLEDEHRQIRLGYREPPRSASKYKARPFAEVKDEYLAWGKTQGGIGGRPWSAKHAYYKATYLAWWVERLHFETMGDLDGILSKVENSLRDLKAKGKAGKSLLNYSEALKSFCLWCEKRGFLDHDPLKNLERFDTTPTKVYRALTREELRKLLSVAPENRQLVYATASTTGLRLGELIALRVSDLNTDLKVLNLHAEWTKNRKPGLQPLPLWLMKRLQESVKGKAPSAPLLDISTKNATRRFYKDLKNAGIPRFVPGEGITTFHSLRATFATLLIEDGADVKTAMTLMRHSTPDLTVNRYAKARREKLVEFTETVGEVARAGVESESKCAIRVHRTAANLVSGGEIKDLMAGTTGLETPRATSQNSDNSKTETPQNPAQSNTSKDKASPPDDKTIPTPGQEKDTLLHSKSAIRVHQDSLRLMPELDFIIKVWPDLSNEVRETIMAMVTKKEERK